MGRKGSSRNEQKSNVDRVEQAKKREKEAADGLRELLRIPIQQQRVDHAERVRMQRGILKRARQQLKKSETHSRTGKKGKP